MCNTILRPEAVPASSRSDSDSSSPRVGAGSASDGQNSRSNVAQAAPAAAAAVETNVDFILDQIGGMRNRESTTYSYQTYLRARIEDDVGAGDSSLPAASTAAISSTASCWFQPSWREQICEWCYSVVDHFDLSRETVAISLSLFDRYLATLGNKCTGDLALLASLTTTHIAIKILETRKIRLTTLCKLSRGLFGPKEIEDMEWTILTALEFQIHPPTASAFVSHMVDLLPPFVLLKNGSSVHVGSNRHAAFSSSSMLRREVIDYSRYLAELAVCDLFFVEFYPSTVAYAAVLNVLETNAQVHAVMTPREKERYIRLVSDTVQLHPHSPDVVAARERLRMIVENIHGPEQPETHPITSEQHHDGHVSPTAEYEDIPRTCTYDEAAEPQDSSDISSCLEGDSIASSRYTASSCGGASNANSSSSARKKLKKAAGATSAHHPHHKQSLARAVSPVFNGNTARNPTYTTGVPVKS
mmetsp:Transcript_26878/g.58300  ORF Transcript_26878/g.58300 Transcript_26878/m.58300 type:complete len:472 (+) Transcript_26878:173-1588(+)